MDSDTTAFAVEVGREWERKMEFGPGYPTQVTKFTSYLFYCGRKPDGSLSLSQYDHEATLMNESVANDLVDLLKLRHPARTMTLLKAFSTRPIAENLKELGEVNPNDPLIHELQRLLNRLFQEYSAEQLMGFIGGTYGAVNAQSKEQVRT